jgi:hypothetical protein
MEPDLVSWGAPSLGRFETSWTRTERSFSISQVEADVVATPTRDRDPIHNDPAWTKTSRGGNTIAHRVHVLSRLASIVKSAVDEVLTEQQVSGQLQGAKELEIIGAIPRTRTDKIDRGPRASEHSNDNGAANMEGSKAR